MDSIIHRLFLASLSHIVSARFVTFVYQWWRVRSARGCLYISESNVSVHPRRTLCAVGVERLVGIFILAVHALALSEIVAASSMLFARGWWRVHFTCGSQYILIPTSAFTLAPLVARRGATPCWILFFIGCSWLRFPKSYPRGS